MTWLTISAPNVSEDSVAGRMPTILPPETMAIRSQVVRSSSSSDEIITTVIPLSRLNLLSASSTRDFAPTSMPRVGSSRIIISGRIDKLRPATATLLFYLYALLNGVVLSSIFIIYELPSIAYTFFITAGVFGAMNIYGLITKNDMTKFGNYCIMALFGLIIASLVNIFMHSESLDWIISLVGVALFIGLTAWDTQKIKEASYNADPSQVGKLATIGALSLYLDFINLFLYLLRFFGKSRD